MPPLAYCFQRQRIFPQVDAGGTGGDRDIEPVVDEYTRASLAGFGHRETHQIQKRARLEIFLPDLNPRNSGSSGTPNRIVKKLL